MDWIASICDLTGALTEDNWIDRPVCLCKFRKPKTKRHNKSSHNSQPESNTETNILPILSLIPVKVEDRRSLSVFVSPEKSNLKDHPRQNEFYQIYGVVLLPFLEEKTKFQLKNLGNVYLFYIFEF